jgi:hypothetical protein
VRLRRVEMGQPHPDVSFALHGSSGLPFDFGAPASSGDARKERDSFWRESAKGAKERNPDEHKERKDSNCDSER